MKSTECLNSHLNIHDLSHWVGHFLFCLEMLSVISMEWLRFIASPLHWCPMAHSTMMTALVIPIRNGKQERKPSFCRIPARWLKESLQTSCLWSSPEQYTEDYKGGMICILPKNQCISEKQNHTGHAETQRMCPLWLFLLSPTHLFSPPLHLISFPFHTVHFYKSFDQSSLSILGKPTPHHRKKKFFSHPLPSVHS